MPNLVKPCISLLAHAAAWMTSKALWLFFFFKWYFQKFAQCVLIIVMSFPNSTQIHPSFPAYPTVYPLLFLLTHQLQVCCPCTLGCVAVYWRLVDLPKVTYSKKTLPHPAASNCQ